MIPPLSTRLEFRRWQRSDVALASSLWSDPRVMHFLGGPYSHEEVVERIERELANNAAYGVQYWPLFTRDTGTFAGCCGLKPHEPERAHWEIGFHFRPEFWGAGYATEAARAVMRSAIDELHAAALFAGHHPENRASGALLAKLGFQQIGTHHFARTGLEHPWYVHRTTGSPSPAR
ncbi:MAG: GNAT family N-acetyltransferase [Thermoanaerobaculia bacterium]